MEQPQGSDEQAERPAAEQQLTTEDLQETHAEYARWIDRAEPLDRVLLGRYRRQQFGDVKGRVLDVACGTGTNFSYLPGSVDLVGIDISDDMLAYAESELERLDGDGTLFQMDAASLEFEDDRFDFVISRYRPVRSRIESLRYGRWNEFVRRPARFDSSSTGEATLSCSLGFRSGERTLTTRKPGVERLRSRSNSSSKRGYPSRPSKRVSSAGLRLSWPLRGE